MTLRAEALAAIKALQRVGAEFGSEVVILGAVAYAVWVDDPWRRTEDVDVAVAIDLDQFPSFSARLIEHGWRRHPRREQRWYSSEGATVDIIPAGPQLRSEGQIVWPETETVMSLMGFRHVFDRAVPVEIGDGERIQAKVIPLPVYMFLKIAAYLDRPGAGKDIMDIAALLERYESDGVRRFSDPVVAADVGFQQAGAYLLGTDVGAICNDEETRLVGNFLDQALDPVSQAFSELVRTAPAILGEKKEQSVTVQLGAFRLGFQNAHSRA